MNHNDTANHNTAAQIQRQLELEVEGVQAGINNYRGQVASGGLMSLSTGANMVSSNMHKMVAALDDFMMPQRGSSQMQGVRSLFKRLKVSTDELAFITLQHVLQEAIKNSMIQTAAITLTERIMDQHEYNKFKAAHKGYLKKIEEGLTISSQKHKRTVVMLKKRQKGIEDDPIEREDKLRVGSKLIELAILSTGLVERQLSPKSDNKTRGSYKDGDVYKLQLTEETSQWIEKVHDRCELLSPVLLPMIIPPRKWEGIKGGG